MADLPLLATSQRLRRAPYVRHLLQGSDWVDAKMIIP